MNARPARPDLTDLSCRWRDRSPAWRNRFDHSHTGASRDLRGFGSADIIALAGNQNAMATRCR
jgi:hypothetical protein